MLCINELSIFPLTRDVLFKTELAYTYHVYLKTRLSNADEIYHLTPDIALFYTFNLGTKVWLGNTKIIKGQLGTILKYLQLLSSTYS